MPEIYILKTFIVCNEMNLHLTFDKVFFGKRFLSFDLLKAILTGHNCNTFVRSKSKKKFFSFFSIASVCKWHRLVLQNWSIYFEKPEMCVHSPPNFVPSFSPALVDQENHEIYWMFVSWSKTIIADLKVTSTRLSIFKRCAHLSKCVVRLRFWKGVNVNPISKKKWYALKASFSILWIQIGYTQIDGLRQFVKTFTFNFICQPHHLTSNICSF